MKNFTVFNIDPVHTPFSPQAAMLILGLNETTYLNACNRGKLAFSIEHNLVKTEVIRHHSFYDILYFALRTDLAFWETIISEDIISDLVEVCYNILTRHVNGDSRYYIDYAHSNLNYFEKSVVEKVLKIWVILAKRTSIEFKFTKNQKMALRNVRKNADPRQLNLFE